MRIRIGVITSEAHMDYMCIIQNEFKKVCDIKLFIVNQLKETDELYLKNRHLVDGFIFSGMYIYDAIKTDHLDVKLPMRVLQDNENVLYKELFRLLITKPDLDISRIYVDFAHVLDSFSEFKDYFAKQSKPIEGDDLYDKVDIMLKNHIALWKEDKIDLSITAFGNFLPKLKKHGIRHILIRPSLEHVREVFRGIINEITIIKLNNSRAVVAYVSIEAGDEDATVPLDERLNTLKRSTREFLHTQNIVDTVQIVDRHIQICTTYGDFVKITSNVQNCSLLDYLNSEVNGYVKVGWGSGQEYYQARENASKANRQAKAYTGSCSFFINEDQKVVGPLRNTDIIKYCENGDPEIMQLAQNIDMNNINLQKIVSYAEIIGTNKLSSEDVAQCLSITVRGANRILNKIEEKEYAKAVFEKRENNKGRPKKYFELIFLDKNGNSA